jgi:hypothetical protein
MISLATGLLLLAAKLLVLRMLSRLPPSCLESKPKAA